MSPPDVLTVERLEPWIGREMADENQVERLFHFGNFREDPHPSEIVRTRSEHRWRIGELYAKMVEKDSDLAGILLKREDAVLSLPRLIEPRDSSPQADEAAQLCRYALAKIPNLADNLRHQLTAHARGNAFEEVIWDQTDRGPYAGAWLPRDLIDRPPWRFAFRDRRLLVRRAKGEPIPAPPGKFLAWRRGTKDSGWAAGELDKVYWYWFLKKHGWKWYAVHVEKWASPTVLVYYEALARELSHGGESGAAVSREQQQKALAIARAIQQEMVAALPKGITLDTFEAKRSGNDAYSTFIALCNRAMALVFLGEINTSGFRPGVGAYASDKVSNEVRREKVVLDAHDLGAHLTDNLLRPIVEVNLGPDHPVPRFVVDHFEGDNREQRRNGIEAALEDGLPVPKRYYLQTMQVPVPREGEDVVTREAQGPPPAAPPPPEPAPPWPARRARARLAAENGSADRGTADERQAASAEVATTLATSSIDYWTNHQALAAEAYDRAAADRAFQPAAWLAGQLAPAAAAERLLAAQAHGVGLAVRELLADGLPSWSLRRGEPASSPLDLPLRASRSRLQAAPPDGWERHLTWATAADYWSELLDTPRTVFDSLEDVNRRFAFTVAGLEDVAALRDVNDLTRQSLTEGLGREEFRRRLADLYERRGLTPTSDWHADLVYQNNLSQAQGALRYAQTVGNPAAHSLFPYLAFQTLDDERVRERTAHNHRIVHSLAFAIGHAFWRTWWYPAGHSCRCYILTITRAEALRRGWVGAEPTGPWPIDPQTGDRALPDPGFRSAPSLAATTDQAIEPAIERHLDAAERDLTGTPGLEDLLLAFRLLFEALGLTNLLEAR